MREAQVGTATGWLGHGPCRDLAEAGADEPGGWHGAVGKVGSPRGSWAGGQPGLAVPPMP